MEVEQTLSKESEDLEKSVNKLKNEQYEPLHGTCALNGYSSLCVNFGIDQVNEIRLKNGMSKLPHIQQELEAKMAK